MSGQLGNAAQLAILALIFQNAAWSNIGNAGGLQPSSVAGSLFASLATASLTGTATQATSEAAYTSYARQAIVRSSGGWATSGSSPTQSANVAAVTFPQCTGGTETEVSSVIGSVTSGTGQAIWLGALTASLAVSNLITPAYAISALVATIT